MKTQTLDLKDAQGHLTELVHRVITGVHIVLQQDNKPIAELVPTPGRSPGLHTGAICANDDFDVPLSDKFWTEEK